MGVSDMFFDADAAPRDSLSVRATRAVLERAEQMGGPAAKQRLLFVCRRFEQGELPDEQMLGELECLFAHTLQRTMEQVSHHAMAAPVPGGLCPMGCCCSLR